MKRNLKHLHQTYRKQKLQMDRPHHGAPFSSNWPSNSKRMIGSSVQGPKSADLKTMIWMCFLSTHNHPIKQWTYKFEQHQQTSKMSLNLCIIFIMYTQQSEITQPLQEFTYHYIMTKARIHPSAPPYKWLCSGFNRIVL